MLLVEVERLEHPANEAVLVVGVEDLEILRQPRIQMVGPQQAVGDAVEGADPHAAHAVTDHFSTRAHLTAALLVKVTAMMEKGEQRSTCISQAIRCTSTRVLPEPAPASTSRLQRGPPPRLFACH